LWEALPGSRLPRRRASRPRFRPERFNERPDYNGRESRLPPAIPGPRPHRRYGRYGRHTKTERHRPERPTPLMEASEAYVARLDVRPAKPNPRRPARCARPQTRGGASTARIASAAAMRQVSPNLDKEPPV
jgi:hypothetical protein